MICLRKIGRFSLFILAALLCLIASRCAPVKMVERRGVMMREDQAASLDFQECEKLFGNKRYKDSMTCFDIFKKTYPRSKLVPDALYRNAITYKNLGDAAKAQATLEEIALKYPLSHIINDARYGLGRIYMHKKMYKQARDALSAINHRLYDQKKQLEILQALREALKILGLWKELADCDIKIYDISTEFNFVSEIKREITDTVETKLSEQELGDIFESRRDTFPGDIALLKLLNLSYQRRDFGQAKELSLEFMRRFPVSENYEDAMEIYRRIAERKDPDPRTIGLLLPLTGPNSAIGELALKGIWLASGFYETGRRPDDDIKIAIRDTEGNADVTEKAFDELVYEEGAIGIIGPMLARTSEVGAVKAEELGVPVILLNQDERITQQGDFIFRNFVSKEPQARILVKFAVENLGIRRFAFLYPNHSYGTEFFNAFWDELLRYPDVEVRGAEKYEPSINDFSEPIKKLVGLYDLNSRSSEICTKKLPKLPQDPEKPCFEPDALPPITDFEALVIPDSFEKIIQIAPALLYHNVKGIQLLGCNLWDSKGIFKENSGKYIQGAVITDVFSSSSKKAGPRTFIDSYNRVFGEEPDIIAAHAFEAAKIIFKAIGEGRPQNHDQLKGILKGRSDFETISGTKSFFNKGNFEHDYSLLIVDGNEFKEIF